MNYDNSDKTINGASSSFIINIIIIVLIIVLSVTHKENPSKSSIKKNNIESQKLNSTEIPNSYSQSYFLKKGEVVIVQIPRNYYYGLDGGGQKYYRQAYHNKTDSYGPKELIGGGLLAKDIGDDISQVRLSPYEKEITVVITFSKDKSQIK